MTQREIHDADGTRWTLVQAYDGPTGDSTPEAAAEEAARRATDGPGVRVVATPSGGAQTVRLTLEPGWDETLTDDALSDAVARAQASSGDRA